MPVDEYKTLILAQMKAALATLSQCIAGCPEEDWHERHGDYPFSQVVFHTLFFTDYYLQGDNPGFKEQPFHRTHPEFFQDYEELEWRDPINLYDRATCMQYLDFCVEKSEAVIAADTEQTLLGPSGCAGKEFSRAELYVYVIRHIQHHAAQLGLRVQMRTGRELEWVSRG